MSGPRALREPLQVGLDRLQRAGVDQLAQLLLAEQLAQQLAVQRQRGGAALGVGLVALVHVRRDVVEQQRGGERRGGLRSRPRPATSSRRCSLVSRSCRPGRSSTSRRTLAVGLEHDRELRVAARDLQQRLRLQPLLPQRRAPARVGARDQQRAAGVLAEAGAEQGAAAELAHDEVLELVRLDQHELLAGRLVGVGEVDDDAVVGPDRVRLQAVLLADPGAQTRGPRRRARGRRTGERTHTRQSPISSRKRSIDDRAVARDDPRRLLLLAQELEQVDRGLRVEVVVVAPASPASWSTAQRAKAPIASPSSRGRPSPSPFQNGTAPGTPGRGRDDHAVAGDLLDPPRRRAEQEDLARRAPRRPSPRRARRRGGRRGG